MRFCWRPVLPAHRLVLEITEGVLIEDFEFALTILRQLKSLGVLIAIDDFGIGYSSLSYLHTFPLDKIKIDQSFIAGYARTPRSAAIIRAVIGLGKGLNLPVLAEGVETQAQFEFLAGESCSEVQGYLLGRPQPISHYKDVVGRGSADEVLRRMAWSGGHLASGNDQSIIIWDMAVPTAAAAGFPAAQSRVTIPSSGRTRSHARGSGFLCSRCQARSGCSAAERWFGGATVRRSCPTRRPRQASTSNSSWRLTFLIRWISKRLALQREGYVQALISPDFLNAIKQGMHGKIRGQLFRMGGIADQRVVADWHVIDGEASARVIAGSFPTRRSGALIAPRFPAR